jgi:hypothetical protein
VSSAPGLPAGSAAADRLRVFSKGKDLSGKFGCRAGMRTQFVIFPKTPERAEKLWRRAEMMAEFSRPRISLLNLRGTPPLDRHESGPKRYL